MSKEEKGMIRSNVHHCHQIHPSLPLFRPLSLPKMPPFLPLPPSLSLPYLVLQRVSFPVANMCGCRDCTSGPVVLAVGIGDHNSVMWWWSWYPGHQILMPKIHVLGFDWCLSLYVHQRCSHISQNFLLNTLSKTCFQLHQSCKAGRHGRGWIPMFSLCPNAQLHHGYLCNEKILVRMWALLPSEACQKTTLSFKWSWFHSLNSFFLLSCWFFSPNFSLSDELLNYPPLPCISVNHPEMHGSSFTPLTFVSCRCWDKPSASPFKFTCPVFDGKIIIWPCCQPLMGGGI